jgi:hypothetical protein
MQSLFAFLRRNAGAAIVALLCSGMFAGAQGFIGIFQNGTSNAPSVYGIGDTLSGLYFGTGFTGFTKHEVAGTVSGANLPVLSTCGTSPALGTGSTDHAGKITVGTSASAACTLTFGTTYTTAPFCVVQNLTSGAPANVYVVSATTIVWSSVLADSTVLEYICIGEGV